MGIVDTPKGMLVPDNEPGVALKCTDCGEMFNEPLDRCPNCGSTDVKEIEGFDMRPDAGIGGDVAQECGGRSSSQVSLSQVFAVAVAGRGESVVQTKALFRNICAIITLPKEMSIVFERV